VPQAPPSQHHQHVQAGNKSIAVRAGQRQALDLEQVAEEQDQTEQGARAQVVKMGAPQEGRQQQHRQRKAHQDDPHRRERDGEILHGGEGRPPHENDQDKG
jgi:AMMECR1 domain-containing protein